MLGLDQAASVVVGAAPTPPEVIEFFHALGIPLAEGWGMSETCGVGTVNRPGRIKIGTVGPPVPGIEIRLAEDGEVLIRGDNMMVGYRNQPEKTAETIDGEGWLATGDIGEIDDEGYLKIVDRKKELIINAAGKNMSPANIESSAEGRDAAHRPGVRASATGAPTTPRSSSSTPISRRRGPPSTGSAGTSLEELAGAGRR